MVRIERSVDGGYEYYLYKDGQDYKNNDEAVLIGAGFATPEELLQTLADFASGILHKTVEPKDIPHVTEF